MEANAGTAMYPLHRCKTIYLVRHAQGIHNVEGDKDHSAYKSPALFDAHITPLGWNQVDCLREHVKKCGLAKKIELVITSPLLRTMQTAVGVFGGENYTDGIGAPPLMVENAGHSGRLAISSLNCPPFLAVEACRERLGVNPCDKRRSITEYRALFPAIDFSLIENDEDVLWEPGVREADEPVAARGMKFIDWLWTREEKEIAIVTHSAFLDQTLIMYSRECHPTIRQELGKRYLILVDDVWSSTIWQVIKSALPDDKLGSRIMVTTRIRDVATSSRIHQSDIVHEVEPLGAADSKALFTMRFDPSGNRSAQEMEDVWAKVSKGCGGVPLAIINIAGLLTSKPAKVEQIARTLSTQERLDADGMRKVLYLSYSDLSHNLKSCLLYMSVFPEAYNIRKDQLIRMWIAEGFVCERVGESLQETGEGYLNELIERNLVQQVSIDDDNDHEIGYPVHDMVRELIISLSVEECVHKGVLTLELKT